MTFQIDRNLLLSALQHISYGVANAKKTKYMAANGSSIYRCFIFHVDCNKLTIDATDLDVFISETVNINNPTTERKTFAIEARPFLRIIKTLESQCLDIKVLEYQIIVTHLIGSFAFPLDCHVTTFEALKKPAINSASAHKIRLEAPGLRSILNRCSFAMGNDRLRPVMNGVCLRFTNEFTDFAASDGLLLTRIRKRPMLECESPVDMIIPRQVASILQAILPQTGFVEVEFNEFTPQPISSKETAPAAVCVVYIDSMRIMFTPIRGIYPNYNSVIPTRFSFSFSVNRRIMIKSLERLITFANDYAKLVAITLTPGCMSMAAEDEDFGAKASEEILCQYSGNKFRIGFKIPFLLSILKKLTTPDITFSIVDESRACVITPTPQPDSEEITMLIMPMLLKD